MCVREHLLMYDSHLRLSIRCETESGKRTVDIDPCNKSHFASLLFSCLVCLFVCVCLWHQYGEEETLVIIYLNGHDTSKSGKCTHNKREELKASKWN